MVGNGFVVYRMIILVMWALMRYYYYKYNMGIGELIYGMEMKGIRE